MKTETLEEVKARFSESPLWRDDFELHLEKVVDGIPIYRVTADPMDSDADLRIAQLNELLESKSR